MRCDYAAGAERSRPSAPRRPHHEQAREDHATLFSLSPFRPLSFSLSLVTLRRGYHAVDLLVSPFERGRAPRLRGVATPRPRHPRDPYHPSPYRNVFPIVKRARCVYTYSGFVTARVSIREIDGLLKNKKKIKEQTFGKFRNREEKGLTTRTYTFHEVEYTALYAIRRRCMTLGAE